MAYNCDLSSNFSIISLEEMAERYSRRGEAVNKSRSEVSSMARTRTKVRRWCVHHGASRKATLTFREEDLPADVDEMWRHVENFRKRLKRAGVLQPLLVPEAGSKSGRLHMHGAMREYIPQSDLEQIWGHGFVSIDRRKASGESERDITRRQASYLAGYVAKIGSGSAFDLVGFNRKRYSIPKGTSPPPPVRITGDSLGDIREQAEALCGHSLGVVWTSDGESDWEGPTTAVLQG